LPGQDWLNDLLQRGDDVPEERVRERPPVQEDGSKILTCSSVVPGFRSIVLGAAEGGPCLGQAKHCTQIGSRGAPRAQVGAMIAPSSAVPTIRA
jgi:hypothetical protein